MFLGGELESFVETMASHLEPSGQPSGAHLVVGTRERDGVDSVVAAAYFAPETMAQGVMNLLFVGVDPVARRLGLGKSLLEVFEESARAAESRLAVIETASDSMFAPAWAMYLGAGYDEEARVRDFYDDGLDKLVFRKRLR
jgi:ribosomal protein S18 acetylase RimI-like enzyme